MVTTSIGGSCPQPLPTCSISAAQEGPSITDSSLRGEATAQPQTSPSELQDEIQIISSSTSQLSQHAWLAENAIPRPCRVNTNHRIAWDHLSPAQTQSNPNQRLSRVWKRVLAYVNGECRRLWGRSIRSRGAENQNDEWVLTVSVIFQDANGQEILRHARAKVDTGNPKNLISPAFTAQFGFAFDAANERVILELPGGGLYVSTAKLAGRWSCKVNSSRNSPFKFDPKFMDAEFEVSNTDERFDVVIGSDTISEERLLEWGPGIALTGFRTKLKTYNEAEIEEAERRQKKACEENLARKKALQHGSSISNNTQTSTSNATGEKS